jgi:hypothetical protein
MEQRGAILQQGVSLFPHGITGKSIKRRNSLILNRKEYKDLALIQKEQTE